MTYYPTLEEDLARAKEILAKSAGKATHAFRPDHNGECLECDDWLDEHVDIAGADIYAAYKLLESFVAEIERLQHSLTLTTSAAEDVIREQVALIDTLRAKGR